MNSHGWVQILLFFAVVLLLVKPLGAYMARVYEGKRIFGLSRVLRPTERFMYRVAGVDAETEMGWKRYAATVLVFSAIGFLLLYLLQRIQGWLPGGPAGVGNVSPGLSFNTAVSFVTNTNWQAYAGESTMKYVTQMVGSRCRTSSRPPSGWRSSSPSYAVSPVARPTGWAISGWT